VFYPGRFTFLPTSLHIAISETSFRDRQGKAQLLQDTVEGFSPVYAPTDTSINAANFQTTIDGADAANSNVETLAGNYTTSATQRVALVKMLGALITQALSYIKSNSNWSAHFKAAKMAADKFRGIRPPKDTTPAQDPGDGTTPPTAEKKRNQGQRAYAELVAHYQSFVNAATSCSGYAPPSTDISLMKLNEHLSTFKGLNQFITTLDGQLTTARTLRFRLYFAEAGLQKKFQSVKDAVKGQYGQNSAQFAAIKSIKW
jgi:hypothetical protein